ncbi:unnamed protein product, partial [Linum tenue]
HRLALYHLSQFTIAPLVSIFAIVKIAPPLFASPVAPVVDVPRRRRQVSCTSHPFVRRHLYLVHDLSRNPLLGSSREREKIGR